MTPERWHQIDDLLQKMVDVGAAERTALLGEACAADADLRYRVETLLSFQPGAQSFLEIPALAEVAHILCDEDALSLEGLSIGRYRIGAELGAGGMGEVYLAEDTNLDIKVAIKFLPPYLAADDDAKRRLIREAKAAAQLDHPNICSVYEVREEADQSFIVMQYIAGETLAERIGRAPLAINEILDLIIQVVEALAEAHSRRIVHRDIKPRNIMINARGQVKVLDFGIAQVPESSATTMNSRQSREPLSRTSFYAGTPAYMSPEQASARVDARSDLFAVGVILYECLTGAQPFVGETDAEILRQVREHHPAKPSRSNPAVSKSLDRIVLKLLAKEPGKRYQSAEELLRQLRSAREDLARKKTARELIRKVFFHRPLIVWPAVTVLILSVYFVVLPILRSLLWPTHHPPVEAVRWYDLAAADLRNGGYYDASKKLERALAVDEKFALAHARLAEAYAELDYTEKAKNEVIRAQSLSAVFTIPANETLKLQAIANTVLRDFAPAIATYQRLVNEASSQDKAGANFDLGRAYEKNDQVKEAREHYLTATTLAAEDAASFLHLGSLCGQQQDLKCAMESFEKAAMLFQIQNNSEGLAEVYYERGFVLFNQRKFSEASIQLEKALELARTNSNPAQVSKTLLVLSSTSVAAGDPAKAEQQAKDGIEWARANGIESQAASGLIWLGVSYQLRGDYPEAEKYYQQALELAQRDKMRRNEAWAQVQLGSLRSSQRRTDEALQFVEPAVSFFKERGYRKWLSQALPLLVRAYRDKGDYQAARKAADEQLQLGEQLGDQSQVAQSHEEIGSVLSNQEQYPEALAHYTTSYEINKSLNSKVYVAYAAMHRAGELWKIGDYDGAGAAINEASVVADAPEARYKQLSASLHMIRGLIDLSQGRFSESERESREALDLAGSQLMFTAIQSRYTLGTARVRAGAFRSGKEKCAEAVELANAIGDPRLLGDARLALAEALLAASQPNESASTARRALETFAGLNQKESEWRAWVIIASASAELGDGTAHESAVRAEAALSSLSQSWGADAYAGYLARPDILVFRAQLDRLLSLKGESKWLHQKTPPSSWAAHQK